MTLPSPTPIRVLIVDDSAFVRHSVSKYLEEYTPDIQVIGTAWNGNDALRQIPELQPDVVTLDLHMPHMDGLKALREIMACCPRPVIMVSSLTREGAQETIDALSSGAVDFVTKPDAHTHLTTVIQQLAEKIREAARAKINPVLSFPPPPPAGVHLGSHRLMAHEKVVVIGSSTGGPRALGAVIPYLRGDLPAAVLVVQHMPPSFTRSLAERLNGISALSVKEAAHNLTLEAGQVYVAPGGNHMVVNKAGQVQLNQNPAVNGVRPAVDVTMTSVSQYFGSRAIGVVLTGMGRDGTVGAGLIRRAGGQVIAEDASTCVVWGMPRSVVEAGEIDLVVPLPEVAAAIERMVKGVKNGS